MLNAFRLQLLIHNLMKKFKSMLTKIVLQTVKAHNLSHQPIASPSEFQTLYSPDTNSVPVKNREHMHV